jgi:3-phosphoshikimate 1-carboxyvinyltransferase
MSSQFVSALLIVAPLAESPVEIRVTTPLQSKPYVSMTMEAMKDFGTEAMSMDEMQRFTTPVHNYSPSKVIVEKDWSSAAYHLAAGALTGEVTVEGLELDSNQADKAILDILTIMGAAVTLKQGKVTVEKDSLKAIEYDLSNTPDLFPIVSALCTQAKGISVLHGLHRLQWKESDRVDVMMKGIQSMGGDFFREKDVVKIKGTPLNGSFVDPFKDHRIAMSMSILGLVSSGTTTIMDAECVSKSYPEFWVHLEALGAEVKRSE